MKAFRYFLLLVLVAAYEALLRNATSILGVSIDLPAILVMAIALHESELEAVWFGFIVGVVMAAITPNTMGWHALALSMLAFGAFHARERLNLDSPLARLSLIITGVLIHNILMILVDQPADIVYQVWRYALTGTFYSAVITSIFFIFRQSTVTGKRYRAT